MKFVATKVGIREHRRIYPGDTFEAPDDFECSWAEPVEEAPKKAPASKKAAKKKPAAKAK